MNSLASTADIGSLDSRLRKILEEIIQLLDREIKPLQVILYGSRASGHADEDSDLDILIIAPSDDRPLDRRLKVRRLLSSFDQQIGLDILFYTPEEAQLLAGEPSSFLHSITQRGLLIYDRKDL